jgi:alternate signal-mediated exported protein
VTTTTGVVALAAAVLLLGGAGGCAHPDELTARTGGPVAGDPRTTAGAWADVTSGPAVPIPDIAGFAVAPGAVLTYTMTSTLHAAGSNAPATLGVDPTSITGDPDLLAALAVSTAVTVDGAPATTLTEAHDGHQVQAVVTLDVDESLPDRTRLGDLDLSALRLVLQQNGR